MDFNKLIPDFNSIGKTEWNKPYTNTKDYLWLGGIACAALLVIFVFIPWFKVSSEALGITVASGSRLGITLWYGIFALIGGVIAVYGMLYERYAFAFWGAVIALIMSLVGMFAIPATVEVTYPDIMNAKTETEIVTAADIKISMKAAGSLIKVSRIGAILTLVASIGVGACSFLKLNK